MYYQIISLLFIFSSKATFSEMAFGNVQLKTLTIKDWYGVFITRVPSFSSCHFLSALQDVTAFEYLLQRLSRERRWNYNQSDFLIKVLGKVW